jgi:hypothetical protein
MGQPSVLIPAISTYPLTAKLRDDLLLKVAAAGLDYIGSPKNAGVVGVGVVSSNGNGATNGNATGCSPSRPFSGGELTNAQIPEAVTTGKAISRVGTPLP